jgi:hypothetical protein
MAAGVFWVITLKNVCHAEERSIYSQMSIAANAWWLIDPSLSLRMTSKKNVCHAGGRSVYSQMSIVANRSFAIAQDDK